MLHKFLEPGDWFAAKRLGYGAGFPLARQGWVLLLAYAAIMLGFGLLVEWGAYAEIALGVTGMVCATALFVWVVKRRTRGGWRWRSGETDGERRKA